MKDTIYSILVNNKRLELGLSPINQFDLTAMIELAESIYNSNTMFTQIDSVAIESFCTYMPNVPGKIVFELER